MLEILVGGGVIIRGAVTSGGIRGGVVEVALWCFDGCVAGRWGLCLSFIVALHLQENFREMGILKFIYYCGTPECL